MLSTRSLRSAVRCEEDNVGHGALVARTTSACSFRLTQGIAAGTRDILSFRIAAHAVAHCASLVGTAECKAHAPHPPPPPPPSLPSPPPPASFLASWQHSHAGLLTVRLGLDGPISDAWPVCPLKLSATFDRGAGKVHVHVGEWRAGAIILVRHDPTAPRCELHLTDAALGAASREPPLLTPGGSMVPRGPVEVEHATLLEQSIVYREPRDSSAGASALAMGGMSGEGSGGQQLAVPGGLLAFRLSERPPNNPAVVYRVCVRVPCLL